MCVWAVSEEVGHFTSSVVYRIGTYNVALTVCTKLHNMCIYDRFKWAPKPLGIDIGEGDAMRPIPHHHVTFAPATHKKKKEKRYYP